MIQFEKVPKASAGFRRINADARQAVAVDGQRPLAASAWQRGPVRVISCVELAEYAESVGGGTGPQWHISITRQGERATDRDLSMVAKAFGLPRVEEDNHHPGKVRHLWCPVDPQKRVDCECKTTEVTITEPDGYRWTNPVDPSECRGCEWEASHRVPCALHAISPPRSAPDAGA